jgi:hypothetical protein
MPAGVGSKAARPLRTCARSAAPVVAQGEIGAADQPAAELRLEFANAVADLAGREAQLLGRLTDAESPFHRFEGEQALDGRDLMRGHGGWGLGCARSLGMAPPGTMTHVKEKPGPRGFTHPRPRPGAARDPRPVRGRAQVHSTFSASA